jgi:hypothetical protein
MLHHCRFGFQPLPGVLQGVTGLASRSAHHLAHDPEHAAIPVKAPAVTTSVIVLAHFLTCQRIYHSSAAKGHPGGSTP